MDPEADDPQPFPYVGIEPLSVLRPRMPTCAPAELAKWLASLSPGDGADLSFDDGWWDVTLVRLIPEEEELCAGPYGLAVKEEGGEEERMAKRAKGGDGQPIDPTSETASPGEAGSNDSAGGEASSAAGGAVGGAPIAGALWGGAPMAGVPLVGVVRYLVRTFEGVQHVAAAKSLRPPLRWEADGWRPRMAGVRSSIISAAEIDALAREAIAVREGVENGTESTAGIYMYLDLDLDMLVDIHIHIHICVYIYIYMYIGDCG